MMDKLISWIASPVPFLIVITTVIIVHELGHYVVARFFGAAIESFSWGFGKSLVEVKDRRGTRWRINWLPLGGFVKFVGESQLPQDVGKIEKGPIGKPYPDLSPWQRLAVSLGGPAMNFLFSIMVLAVVSMTLGKVEIDGVRVVGVEKGMSAEAAGFKPGDMLVYAGDRKVNGTQDVRMVTRFSAGEAVTYTVRRDGAEIRLTATPVDSVDKEPEPGAGPKSAKIGLRMEDQNPHSRRLNPLEAVSYGVGQVGDTIGTTVWVISKFRLDSFSGPVGVFGVADSVTDQTMGQTQVPLWDRLAATAINLTFLAAMLSIGIGFFNLLPIPVLDGGAAVLSIAEGLTGKPIPQRVQEVALTIGLACILTFAVVVTWNDILKIRLG
jgi:regulator of sigma E protease